MWDGSMQGFLQILPLPVSDQKFWNGGCERGDLLPTSVTEITLSVWALLRLGNTFEDRFVYLFERFTPHISI